MGCSERRWKPSHRPRSHGGSAAWCGAFTPGVAAPIRAAAGGLHLPGRRGCGAAVRIARPAQQHRQPGGRAGEGVLPGCRRGGAADVRLGVVNARSPEYPLLPGLWRGGPRCLPEAGGPPQHVPARSGRTGEDRGRGPSRVRGRVRARAARKRAQARPASRLPDGDGNLRAVRWQPSGDGAGCPDFGHCPHGQASEHVTAPQGAHDRSRALVR
mmetsp:Transcript_35239/g.99010  ORF Transcript_35239/g.99010 Transcript_35239/m.99010 type:complete len:213 (+) Transcript_35239:170-808(+)